MSHPPRFLNALQFDFNLNKQRERKGERKRKGSHQIFTKE